MYFLIEDDNLLEKYNTIWDKLSTDIKKEFDSEPVYNKEFLKTKIKSHGNEVTDFHDKEVPKVDCNHTRLAVISLDSALKKDDNYYTRVFLKECKYIEQKVIRHIIDTLSDFSSFNKSDEELMFSGKYLSLKRVFRVSRELLLNLFIIDQAIDELSHLSFKQKRDEMFLNYLYDFKSRGMGS